METVLVSDIDNLFIKHIMQEVPNLMSDYSNSGELLSDLKANGNINTKLIAEKANVGISNGVYSRKEILLSLEGTISSAVKEVANKNSFN